MSGVFNKAALLNLLRKHPNWDEHTLSVKFDVSAVRKLDHYIVRDRASALLSAAHDSIESGKYESFHDAISLLSETFEQFLPDWFNAESFYNKYGVEVKRGQKTSRAINRVCRVFGVTGVEAFNARFAELADALNPIDLPRTASLSIHPCDYLEMSNVDNCWSSCHNLDEGCYRAGTLSYLLDNVSMIFSTVDRGYKPPLYEAPKVTREVFCYGDGVLLQSRLYPDHTDKDTISQYRALVQAVIAECEGEPNLWHTTHDVDAFWSKVKTHHGALHYADYTFSNYNPSLSTLDTVDTTNSSICIGEVPKCLLCYRDITESGMLLCDRCYEGYHCEKCGRSISEDEGHYINGDLYCDDCVSYCENCYEYTLETLVSVYDGEGHVTYMCPDCAREHAMVCEACDEFILTGVMTEHEGSWLCPDCLKDAISEEEVAS